MWIAMGGHAREPYVYRILTFYLWCACLIKISTRFALPWGFACLGTAPRHTGPRARRRGEAGAGRPRAGGVAVTLGAALALRRMESAVWIEAAYRNGDSKVRLKSGKNGKHPMDHPLKAAGQLRIQSSH